MGVKSAAYVPPKLRRFGDRGAWSLSALRPLEFMHTYVVVRCVSHAMVI